MIRRDYLLRMIEQFLQALAQINFFKKSERWQEASGEIEKEFQRLLGADVQVVARFSETELLARLIQGEPTQVVREKTWILITLLREAGDVAAAQHQTLESRVCYLKGLHLLLDVLAEGDVAEFPAFIPKIEGFLAALSDQDLPLETQVRLMRHYERLGEFSKAEDTLFALLQAGPAQPGLVEFGFQFYRRLESQSDAALEAGKLPRSELEAGKAELSQFKSP